MEFFNRKEEVIDVQLTQYGKHLLSKGKFRPVYYAFFDDDIIYDLGFAGGSETQKDAEDRIKGTPRIKAQYNFSGRDLKSKNIDHGWCKTSMKECNKLQVSKDKHYALGIALGSSEINSSHMPAWNIQFLEGSLTGSSPYFLGKREQVRFKFLSSTSTDYSNTTTDKSKFVDLYSNSGKQYRFYFRAGALGSALDNRPLTESTVELIDVLSTGTAAAVATAFATKVKARKENGVPVFKVLRSSDEVTAINAKYGVVKNSSIAGLDTSTTLSLTQLQEGVQGATKYLPIPQLDIDLKAVVKIGNIKADLGDAGDIHMTGIPTTFDDPTFDDGTYLTINYEQLFLDIGEDNSPFLNENFDIEAFKVKEDENGIELLMPLTFQKPVQEIVNGILLDIEDQQKMSTREEIGPESVDYFFDFAVDSEIDPYIGRLPSNIYADRDPNQEEDCPDAT